MSTELVQVDAVVTDGKGRQVTDLKLEDFEIVEDGKPRSIIHCRYLAVESPATPTPEPRPSQAPRPPARPRPEDVRRVVAVVVDDLGMSFTAMQWVREALTRFVDEQMAAGDLVAIVRTGGGMGLLQQLTTDQALLRASIAQLRYNGLALQAKSAFEAAESRRVGDEPVDGLVVAQEALRRQIFIKGTLGALEAVVQGLANLPGRKSMLVFSNRLSLRDEALQGQAQSPGEPVVQAREVGSDLVAGLRRVTDQANRDSVVIYTVDPRSLALIGMRADAGSRLPGGPDVLARQRARRLQEISDDRSGLGRLADDTGGTFQAGVTDVVGAVGRVMEDLKGYYLIGYAPDPGGFTRKGYYHQIAVRVKRPGLKVRSRRGYFGVTDEERRAADEARPKTLASTLVSPFASSDLGVRLTTVFGHQGRSGSLVRSFLHLDGHGLSFEPKPDGGRQVELELLAFAFGENGAPGDQVSRRVTVPVSAETAERLRRSGLVVSFNMPLKKPGPYQVRVVVKDAASQRMGTASRFVVAPDLDKQRLALSGVMMSGATCSDQPVSGADETPEATYAVRRFCPGSELAYGFAVYHPRLDRGSGRPRLEVEVRLARDGEIVSSTPPAPLETLKRLGEKGDRVTAFAAGGSLRLGPSLAPGEYAVEVVVVDTLAKAGQRVASQWVDFEVVAAAAPPPDAKP